MNILNKVIEIMGDAQLASATYKPTTAYKGGLPSGIVKSGSKGSDVKHVQSFLNWCIKAGLTIDGICGAKTVKAIKKFQKQNGLKADGVFGTKTRSKAKSIVNAHKPKTPSILIDKEIAACKAQAEYMKNYTYKWQQNPTIAKSKKYGTCVTYVACVLQRIGILKSGQFIWINDNQKVCGANNKMTVTYMKGTLKSNKSKLKRGDIVIGGNGNTKAAAGSHIFIIVGKWDKYGNPYIYDQASADRVKKGKSPAHTWNKNFRTIAHIRLK